jgi:hypothetical protein
VVLMVVSMFKYREFFRHRPEVADPRLLEPEAPAPPPPVAPPPPAPAVGRGN